MRAYSVAWMPRIIGVRCGTKVRPICAADDLRQALHNLHAVAMPRHAVGFEIVRSLGEQDMRLRLASRPADARLGIGDQVPRIDGTRLKQRQKAELHRGRIAAGIGDDARLADGLAVDLGQAVDRLRYQLGAGVLHLVPFFPFGHVLYAKVGGNIDQAHAGVYQPPRIVHGDGVGRGEEHHVALLQRRRRGVGKGEVDMTAQAGKQLAHRHPRFLARGNGAQFSLRMLRQYAQQLNAGVSGASDHADLDHFPLHIGFLV